MPESKDKGVKIAASLLLKGGTMLSEVCPSCNGILIKFQDNIKCINCESELKNSQAADTTTINTTTTAMYSIDSASENKSSKNHDEVKEISIHADKDSISSALSPATAIIQDKINLLLKSLASETDQLLLRNKGEILDLYLNILSKIVNLKL